MTQARSLNRTKQKEPCNHCGRKDCVKLGDAACTAAREQMWEELRQRVAHWEAAHKRMNSD